MKAGPTDRFLCSISTCPWYFDTPALPTTAEVNRSLQVGVAQALSERARGIDNVLREHFETHTVVEWMTEVNQRQRRATKAEAKLERSRETVAAQSEVIDELRARLAEIAEPEQQWGSRIHSPDGWIGDDVDAVASASSTRHAQGVARRGRVARGGGAVNPAREGCDQPLRDELMAAGIAAADDWLATRAHRRMSEVNQRRLVGHVVNALWEPIVDAALGIAHMASEDVEADRNRLLGEVERLQRPLMVVEVDADLSEEDVSWLRAKFVEAYAADPRPVWRVVEWTLGDEDAPYDAGHVYPEADARRFAADPDSTSVLWTREVTGWRKAKGGTDERD